MANESMIISEKWIKNRLQIESEEEIALLSTLSLPGVQNKGKIGHLGVALQNFVNLKIINLDRNALDSLDGLQFCKRLEKLTVYYNNISALDEIVRLRENTFLKELDLRLNPVTKLHHFSYRLFTIFNLPSLIKLDERDVRESERRTAKEMFEHSDIVNPPPSLIEKLSSPIKAPPRKESSKYAMEQLPPDSPPTSTHNFDHDDDLLIQHLQPDPPPQPPNINNKIINNKENGIKTRLPSKEVTSSTPVLNPHSFSPISPPFHSNQNNPNPTRINNHHSPPQSNNINSSNNNYPNYDMSLYSPPPNPYIEINQNLQLEINHLKLKIEKYKQKNKEMKSLDAENQHMRYQIDMLSQENVHLRNGWKETEKTLQEYHLRDQQITELIAMLKESHQTILKENEHLREEIKDWKLKEEANTKLWQNNYDKLKQHIYATDTKPNKNQ